MRLVLDTNSVLSGLLWGGVPWRLIDAAIDGRIELATSVALLAELEGVLAREKFSRRLARRGLVRRDLLDGYAALATIVRPAAIAPTITRDPSDDQVLAAAVAAEADLVVSGDAHLLDLVAFHGIGIVSAATAVERIGRAG